MLSRVFFSTGVYLVHIGAIPLGRMSFRDRFAYARWLFYGRTGQEPQQTVIAERVGREQPSVGAWYVRESPPPHWQTHQPLADYLGVDRVWLIEGKGNPPEPMLWEWWTLARSQASTREVAIVQADALGTDAHGFNVNQEGATKSSPLDKVRPAPIAAFVPAETTAQRKAREKRERDAKRGKPGDPPRRRQA